MMKRPASGVFKTLTIASLLVASVAFARCSALWGSEPIATDFVANDAALWLEVSNLDQTWAAFEQSDFLQRLRDLPAWQRFVESRGCQQWQSVENQVARQSGQPLSALLKKLFAKSLVLAIDVPPNASPRGILIGEAVDAATVETALNVMNTLEPNETITPREHHGLPYQQRQKQGSADVTYLAISGRWFAITDQEALLKDVMDRFAANNRSLSSLSQSATYQRNRERFPGSPAAFLYINARAWDRILNAAPQEADAPINLVAIWKQISAVSAALHLEGGVVCEAIAELETDKLPSGWTQFVAYTATPADWAHRIPPEALLAFSGHFDASSVLQIALQNVPAREQAEMARNRRVAKSLLGNDLFDRILPALMHDVCGHIVIRKVDAAQRFMLDGAVAFHLTAPDDADVLKGIAGGMETGLHLLAAFFSAKSSDAVTVREEQTDAGRMYWLSESAPVPAAFGIVGNQLLIGSSIARLHGWIRWHEQGGTSARLMDHSRRFFPNANQLVWIDTVQTRQTLELYQSDIAAKLSQGSAEETQRLKGRIDHLRQFLALTDSLFVAGRVESDHIRVTVGGGLDPQPH